MNGRLAMGQGQLSISRAWGCYFFQILYFTQGNIFVLFFWLSTLSFLFPSSGLPNCEPSGELRANEKANRGNDKVAAGKEKKKYMSG